MAGITVRAHQDPIGNIPTHALLAPLPPPHHSVIIAWPLDNDALNVAATQWLERTRPWTCQVCAQCVCDHCGSPTRHPWGCDVLTDDGRVLHVPLLRGPTRCINGACHELSAP